MKSKLKNIVELVWQLPQNMCGIVWKLVNKSNIITSIDSTVASSVDAKVYLTKNRGGVTLGKYIFISQFFKDLDITIRHECGHVRLSKILGPLYLIVIGIPSILHAALNSYTRCCRRNKDGYYHFYTEHILMGEYDIRNK